MSTLNRRELLLTGSLGSGLLHNPHQVPTHSTLITLKGEAATLVIDVAGGTLVDFRLRDSRTNPLSWGSPPPPGKAGARGHFLCLDRWGPPSEAEAKRGMPFHGEASNVVWTEIAEPQSAPRMIRLAMNAHLPLAKLQVRRNVELSKSGSWFRVQETVTNIGDLGRIYNMVQHPTIGPPFLDEQTVIDTNAGKGIMQNNPLPNPESLPVQWPHAKNKGKRVDMRRLRDSHDPNVVSYVINGPHGWVTACSPTHRLMIGYVWKTADYPWFNAWRHCEGGKPFARGLEFGTTGLHQPYPILAKKRSIFNRPLFDYLDAEESRSRIYLAFIHSLPEGFQGVQKLTVTDGSLRLVESGPKRREIVIAAAF